MRVVMDVVERGSGKRVRERVRRARCHDVVVEERPRVQVAVLHRRAAQRRGRVLSRPPRVREVALLVARGNLHALPPLHAMRRAAGRPATFTSATAPHRKDFRSGGS